jgi:hypothetical protein
MRNLISCACLALLASVAAAEETTLTRGNIRVTAEFDAGLEIEEVIIETRTQQGWQIDEFETEDAAEQITEVDVAALAAGSDRDGNGEISGGDISLVLLGFGT